MGTTLHERQPNRGAQEQPVLCLLDSTRRERQGARVQSQTQREDLAQVVQGSRCGHLVRSLRLADSTRLCGREWRASDLQAHA